MRELTAEDFKRGKKNPFFEKLCRKTEVAIEREAYAIYEEVAKARGVTPEMVMQRCLERTAKELKEHE